MSLKGSGYSFDGLPVADVESGTTLLVTGPALGGVRTLLLRMLLRRCDREGALFITADTDGSTTLEEYAAAGGDYDPTRMGIVDCTADGTGDPGRNVHAVGSPGDLTGVGIEFSSLYESLYANGATRVRTGVYTLSPFVVYGAVKPVFRFVHTLTGRIRSADGLGLCAIDPDAVETETLASLARAFDGHVELRAAGGETAVRVRGLPDQPEGWRVVDL